MDKIRQLKRRSSRLFNRLIHRTNPPIQFSTSVNIERKTIVWTLENINLAPTDVGEYVKSPVFSTGSEEVTKWCLRFYPKGKRPSSRTFGFYLYKITPGTKVYVEVKLSTVPDGDLIFYNGGGKVVHQDPEEIGTDEFKSTETLKTSKSLEMRCEIAVAYLPASEDYSRYDSEPRVLSCNCSMSGDFEKLYRNRLFTDVILQVGNKQFPAHKAILASRSKFFQAMFEHPTKEDETGPVNIERVEPPTMANVLQYIYAGRVDDMDVNKAIELFEVADFFALLELQKECSKFLLETISVDNVCSIAAMADLHCEIKLRDAAVHFIRTHSTQVFDKGDWDILVSERPRLAANVVKEIITSFKTDCSDSK